MMNYKYIAELTEQELNKDVVINCYNEENHKTLIIKNSNASRNTTVYTTKNLIFKNNVILEYAGKEYFVHILSSKQSTLFINENFDTIYEYLFKKLENPIDEEEFTKLINSLEQLFEKGNEDINVQIGVIGELLSIEYLYKNGWEDIYSKYHKNNLSKHDIEISKDFKIEIKSTAKDKRIHRFSHDQIYNKHFKIIVGSVLVELVEEGMTLYQLFLKILKNVTDYETKFSIQKLMNHAGVNKYLQGLIFSYESSVSTIKFFDSDSLPKLPNNIPSGISNISYDVICDLAKEIENLNEFIEVQIKS